jgi:hypothetical protein
MQILTRSTMYRKLASKILLLQKVFEHDNNLITTLDMINRIQIQLHVVEVTSSREVALSQILDCYSTFRPVRVTLSEEPDGE